MAIRRILSRVTSLFARRSQGTLCIVDPAKLDVELTLAETESDTYVSGALEFSTSPITMQPALMDITADLSDAMAWLDANILAAGVHMPKEHPIAARLMAAHEATSDAFEAVRAATMATAVDVAS